jgi:hypothetical protein
MIDDVRLFDGESALCCGLARLAGRIDPLPAVLLLSLRPMSDIKGGFDRQANFTVTRRGCPRATALIRKKVPRKRALA